MFRLMTYAHTRKLFFALFLVSLYGIGLIVLNNYHIGIRGQLISSKRIKMGQYNDTTLRQFRNVTSDIPQKSYKLLCWILTSPKDLNEITVHIRNTWGKHCDITLYMSSVENASFPAIGLRVPEGKRKLADKSRAAWMYVFQNFYNKADYFLKADTDTFVVVHNLRRFLENHDPAQPEFFGHILYQHGNKRELFMSGGSGIVVSKEALRRLVQIGIRTIKPDCFPTGWNEDLKSSTCLLKSGCRPVNGSDSLGRDRFLMYPPHRYMQHRIEPFVDVYQTSKTQQGLDCCSEEPISFHRVSPDMMYDFYYAFYKLHRGS